MIPINKTVLTDALQGLKQLPDNCVHCIVTSPPYWNLRDYGMPDQIGLEDTPDEFISKMVDVFHEARRVLRNDGTLWVNIGDSYAAKQKNRTEEQAIKNSTLMGGKAAQAINAKQKNKIVGDLKAKDLVGIPWMLAFALRADGWYLRQDIIWHKPNPLPESVTDRCTKSHEYIFLLTKESSYFFDNEAIMQPVAVSSVKRLAQDIDGQKGSTRVPGKSNGTMKAVVNSGNKKRKSASERGVPVDAKGITGAVAGSVPWEGSFANKRDVWSIATTAFKEAHFATFPEELPSICIKAGTSAYGCCGDCGAQYLRTEGVWQASCICNSTHIAKPIVLDMFSGAGTTGLVAAKLGRSFIEFEINPEYIRINQERKKKELGGLFI